MASFAKNNINILLPLARRLRFYGLSLALVALSVLVVHFYLAVELSAWELIWHALDIALSIAIATALVDLLVSGLHRNVHWRIGYQLKTVLVTSALMLTAILSISTLFLGILPSSAATIEKHVEAGYGNMLLRTLPVVLLVTYLLAQKIRKDYLLIQLVSLKEINKELKAIQAHFAEETRGKQAKIYPNIDFNYQGEDLSLDPQRILHIRADENYCHIFYCKDESPQAAERYMIRITLNRIYEMLPQQLFLQTHRSYLVNILCISHLAKTGRQCELRLHSGETVPVSRARVAEISSLLKSHSRD